MRRLALPFAEEGPKWRQKGSGGLIFLVFLLELCAVRSRSVVSDSL